VLSEGGFAAAFDIFTGDAIFELASSLVGIDDETTQGRGPPTLTGGIRPTRRVSLAFRLSEALGMNLSDETLFVRSVVQGGQAGTYGVVPNSWRIIAVAGGGTRAASRGVPGPSVAVGSLKAFVSELDVLRRAGLKECIVTFAVDVASAAPGGGASSSLPPPSSNYSLPSSPSRQKARRSVSFEGDSPIVAYGVPETAQQQVLNHWAQDDETKDHMIVVQYIDDDDDEVFKAISPPQKACCSVS